MEISQSRAHWQPEGTAASGNPTEVNGRSGNVSLAVERIQQFSMNLAWAKCCNWSNSSAASEKWRILHEPDLISALLSRVAQSHCPLELLTTEQKLKLQKTLITFHKRRGEAQHSVTAAWEPKCKSHCEKADDFVAIWSHQFPSSAKTQLPTTCYKTGHRAKWEPWRTWINDRHRKSSPQDHWGV